MSKIIRACPDDAVIMIKGEHYPCDAMNGMAPDSTTHDGWAHSSSAAEAIWTPAKNIPAQTDTTTSG